MIVLLPILALILFLLGYEFWALATGRKLVTMYIRDAFHATPGTFTLIAFVLGALFDHFLPW